MTWEKRVDNVYTRLMNDENRRLYRSPCINTRAVGSEYGEGFLKRSALAYRIRLELCLFGLMHVSALGYPNL